MHALVDVGSARQVQVLADTGDHLLDRLRRHVALAGDLRGRVPFGHRAKDLHLRLGETGRGARRHAGTSRGAVRIALGGSDGREEGLQVGQVVLGDVVRPPGEAGEGGGEQARIGVVGEQDDSDVGQPLTQGMGEVDPGRTGPKVEVQDRHLHSTLLRQHREALPGGPEGTDHADPAAGQGLGERRPGERIVVDEDDPGGGHLPRMPAR